MWQSEYVEGGGSVGESSGPGESGRSAPKSGTVTSAGSSSSTRGEVPNTTRYDDENAYVAARGQTFVSRGPATKPAATPRSASGPPPTPVPRSQQTPSQGQTTPTAQGQASQAQPTQGQPGQVFQSAQRQMSQFTQGQTSQTAQKSSQPTQGQVTQSTQEQTPQITGEPISTPSRKKRTPAVTASGRTTAG